MNSKEEMVIVSFSRSFFRPMAILIIQFMFLIVTPLFIIPLLFHRGPIEGEEIGDGWNKYWVWRPMWFDNNGGLNGFYLWCFVERYHHYEGSIEHGGMMCMYRSHVKESKSNERHTGYNRPNWIIRK